MADPVQPNLAQPGRGRQDGEADARPYRLTAGLARALQRPGGIAGSTSGSPIDPGRTGLADLGDGETLIPPHTGYGGAPQG